jgi:SAM-dependent methyltransferase
LPDDKYHYHKTLKKFLNRFENKRILDIGSGERRLRARIVNFDLFASREVDVVGDASFLPFKSFTFDAAVLQQVLEHVKSPADILAEVHRILKNGGGFYVELPFVYIYHPDPEDYRRYTFAGLKEELKDFEVTESGFVMGPSSTMSLMLRQYLTMMFAFNNDYLHEFFWHFFGWLTFWIKYLDFFLKHSKWAPYMCAAIYAVAEKRHLPGERK